ncbi:hypothetical protein CYMTET_27922 [Cymbomonas tetramitiformis]|uniref:Uncharacterized protein n=1 Tax=Cymbomonas tetramitiformis TaxID=36881 RepID=A0AAE0FPD7_9CHLO|nr:hypothetical protein CYMTET_27922 [Cymbomonas tetramitiformis]|eukprot:gene14576-17226_t
MTFLLKTFAFTPCDREIGSATECTPSELRQKFGNKSALVIGGTKGIGSGIALQLAESGCREIDIVGRDAVAGSKIVEKMKETQHLLKLRGETSLQSSGGKDLRCDFTYADLSTVQGCKELVESLGEVNQYDIVVMSVGVWPDFRNPLTPSGFHKVLFLDVVARYILLRELYHKGKLSNTSERASVVDKPVVMSVLASGQKISSSYESVKELFLRKASNSYREDLMIPRTLSAVGLSHDSMLYKASSEYPDVTFIGTFPGLVATDVTASTFGHLFAKIANFIAKLLRVMITPRECGLNHVNILASDKVKLRGLTFWDHYLQARELHEKIKETEFVEWNWSVLEKIGSDEPTC